MNKQKTILRILISFCLFALPVFPYSFANELNENEDVKPKIERHFVFEAVPLNLEEIVSASDRIFAGKCINAEVLDNDPESKMPVIKYTFKIIEGIKGVGGKEKITFKQWLPTVRNGSYEKGEKYVLFLYPNSIRGLTSPVGLSSQGQFDIEEKGFIRRKEVVKNKMNNLGLSKNLKTKKIVTIENDKYVNDYFHLCSELGIPMRYREFIQAVRYLSDR